MIEPIIISKIGIRIDLKPDLYTLVAEVAQADDESIHDMLVKIIKSYFNQKG